MGGMDRRRALVNDRPVAALRPSSPRLPPPVRAVPLRRSLLALLLVAGGAYKLFQPADLAAQFAYVPLGVWRALGALEVIGGRTLEEKKTIPVSGGGVPCRRWSG